MPKEPSSPSRSVTPTKKMQQKAIIKFDIQIDNKNGQLVTRHHKPCGGLVVL